MVQDLELLAPQRMGNMVGCISTLDKGSKREIHAESIHIFVCINWLFVPCIDCLITKLVE